jgi:phosphatidylinositol glycan class N
LFMIALSMTDGSSISRFGEHFAHYAIVMTLTFFYRVRDQGASFSNRRCAVLRRYLTGSWLEIGQTISFFIISSLLLVWSGGICSAGQWLMSGALHPQEHNAIRKTKTL